MQGILKEQKLPLTSPRKDYGPGSLTLLKPGTLCGIPADCALIRFPLPDQHFGSSRLTAQTGGNRTCGLEIGGQVPPL